MNPDDIQHAAAMILEAKHVVALTGAGISVESGIPPFRGKGGLWEKIDPMEYATIEAFERDPSKVWHVLIKDMKGVVEAAIPNAAHEGLVQLERWGLLKAVITQNVDGLHQKAGSSEVVEFHGTFAWQRCVDCSSRIATADVSIEEIPPRCECGGILRPDCIFFGEIIPPRDLLRSQHLAATCDLMLVIGTSAVVHPAGYMPVIAKENGAKVIEINPEATPLTATISDVSLMGWAGDIMQQITASVEALRGAAAR
jgi:NAD-dependent deacetylase